MFAPTIMMVLCALSLQLKADQLNLVVIMTDDQGRWALGDYDDRIETPNISHLAANGVRFDQAISPTPVCSPARASFLTGKTASQHGVHDFLSDNDSTTDKWLVGEKLISEVLSEQGYKVGLFGKWHATTQSWTPVRGYDRWLTYDERQASWINQYQHSGTVYFSSDGKGISHTGVQARFLSEEAIRFIDDSGEEPFAAFVNFVEPHFPFEGLPERLVGRYRDIAAEIIAAGDTSSLEPMAKPPATTVAIALEHQEKLAQYLAAVSLVDEQVGRILDALMGRKLLDNTMIIFTSDHCHLTGHYGIYGKTNATVPQNFYQESINIPLIVYGPKSIVAPGQVRHEFVNLYDIYPTLADLTNASAVAAEYAGPGKSLQPLLAGHRLTQFRDFQISEMGNARMIHDGRWKLIQYYSRDLIESPREVWYDLVHPLGERRVVPPPSEAQQEHLRNALTAFFEKYEEEKSSGRRIWELPRHNAMEPWRRGTN
jgi:arylsulfatase A-like enzyme